MIFPDARLDAELALDQILPGMPFLIHLMANSQATIYAREIVADELTAMIGNDLFPEPPTEQRLKIHLQHDADFHFRRERTGENRAREAFKQKTGIKLNDRRFG